MIVVLSRLAARNPTNLFKIYQRVGPAERAETAEKFKTNTNLTDDTNI